MSQANPPFPPVLLELVTVSALKVTVVVPEEREVKLPPSLALMLLEIVEEVMVKIVFPLLK